jgi:peptide/nickel transport system permease protein/oligopeptide transport system permease protein
MSDALLSSVGAPPTEPIVPEPGVATPEPGKNERSASLWADAWRQLIRRPSFLIPGMFLLLIFSMALFPKLWTKQDYRACDIANSRKPPSWDHLLGYNVNGCDYWAHAIYGARPSLFISLSATIGIVLVGGVIGLLAGFYGGWVDAVLSRVMDIFLALPFLLGAIVFLVVVRRQDAITISAILIILGWTTVARVLRGSVLASKNLDYVMAAKALGANNFRLMTRHILPNAVAPVIVLATIALGSFVTAEATLTFLGVGLVPPQASWGIMIAQNEPYFVEFPLLLIFPCIFLVGTVLSFILLGDALRDALDPRLR